MEAEAAKYIGAGLSTIGIAGAAIGLGSIFGNYLSGALRNPSAAASQTATLFIGTVQGLVMQAMLAGDMGRMRSDAPRVFEIYLRGIRSDAT